MERLSDRINEIGAAPAGYLGRRYRVALALVALLVLLDRLVVQPGLVGLLTDAPLINVAGRQRMLSQRLCKAALALDASADPGDQARWRAELRQVLTLWTGSHQRLRRGDASPSIRKAFVLIEPSYDRMHAAAEQLLAGGAPRRHRESLASLLHAEAEFLAGMERIVGLYEREARAHVRQLIALGWGLTAAVLAALAGIGWFILRPAARLIDRQVDALRDARDILEDRVRERTAELERANQSLAHEAEERVRAEQRQRALLEQFSHVARTNTIGEMASGLAHELNQPLGAIANYAEGCIVALESPAPALDEVRAALGRVVSTTFRAGAIVKRIRQFVTRGATARRWLEPNALVQDVNEFFRDEAQRRGIALRMELAPDLPTLWGDPIQLQQVLVNLTRNAFDAIDAAQPLEPSVVMKTELEPPAGIAFAVKDNGEGIAAERIGRLFDAYFSTRDHGMGMGLAISRTIIESHQGTFDVESSPGLGSTFRFTLPTAGGDDAGTDGLRR
ncbi:MAG: ATP-binding protein [Isosphaeraceae bacterium]|nr:ATP-binding protein [Isosphaeraceae bacterium]